MTDRQWYFAKNNQQSGPIPEAQLADLLRSGGLPPDTLVWTEGMAQWAPANTRPELGAAQPGSMSTALPAAAATVAYAGFWMRFVAAIIDSLVTGMAGAMVGFVIGLVYALALGPGVGGQWIAQFIGLIMGWLYFALMESSARQASLGKMAMSIKVTDLDGRRLTFARATGRHFGKIVSALTLFIGYIMAGCTPKKQALHDLMAGCLVIKS